MLFLWLAILGYLLFAINAVIDKFLLTKGRISHPATYAFGIGILSLVTLVLIPFGFSFPGFSLLLLSLLAGSLFTYALLVFFGALKNSDASLIVPIQGGFVPLFTLLLAYWLVGERLSSGSFVAVLLLISGAVLISYQKQGNKKNQFPQILLAILASLLFAFSFVLTKQVFVELGFINGFIWTRIGLAMGALSLLWPKDFRQAIFTQIRRPQAKISMVFLGGQALGALAAVAQNAAIAIGSVSVVNALQGTQFIFLLGLTTLLSIKFPKILKEKMSPQILARKILAIVIISVGIILLVI